MYTLRVLALCSPFRKCWLWAWCAHWICIPYTYTHIDERLSVNLNYHVITWYFVSFWQLWTVALWVSQPMAELVTLEKHMDTEPTTVAIQATDWWEAVLALVYLQEDGLGVHLHVYVCCYCMHVHGGGVGAKHKAWGAHSVVNILQTWQSDLNMIKFIERSRWGIKTWKKERKKKWQWLGEGLEPATWKIP